MLSVGISMILLRNCQLAFRLAESQLDIPSLLDIRDMTDTLELDRRSILTYLSQFYHRFSKNSAWSARPPPNQQLSSHSLPPSLNYSSQTLPDITNSKEANIQAIKELVFNNKTPNTSPRYSSQLSELHIPHTKKPHETLTPLH